MTVSVASTVRNLLPQNLFLFVAQKANQRTRFLDKTSGPICAIGWRRLHLQTDSLCDCPYYIPYHRNYQLAKR